MLQLRGLASRSVEIKIGVEVWKFLGSKYSAAAVWREISRGKIRFHGQGFSGVP